MTMNRVDVTATATELAAWFIELYDDLTTMAETASTGISHSRGRRSDITLRDLKVVQSAADTFLAKHNTPEAAGIIVRPGIVGDEGDIEWWKREQSGPSSRVLFTLTPQTAGFYDFETLEWFRNVVDTGRPTLTGPYVDYAGMDQYILTMTVPFRDGDTIIGAAGCDIEIHDLETAIMPALRRLGADAALVSQHDRIILGNSGRFLVGNRMTELPSGGIEIDVPVHELGLRLVAVPRERY